MLVLLLALRLVDATIVLPNGGVIQRYDWGHGDATIVLPEGGVIQRYEWRRDGDDDPPPVRPRRWDRGEDEEEGRPDGDE